MCLPCLDPVISRLRDLNPFRSKRTGKVKVENENVDRDNINVPFMCEEKRSVIVSDPEVLSHMSLLSVKEENILTLKKVSSLALV